jgi:alkylhydroperoxidase family enzyme
MGLADADIFDLAETVGFFNRSNRMAYALDMMSNRKDHRLDR